MAETIADRPAAIGSARSPLRKPPQWLWTLCVFAQVGGAWLLTRFTYFYADDWLFMRQAQQLPLNLRYLRAGLFQHFSPVSRLLDKLLVVTAPGSFGLAHGIALGIYAAVIIAFALCVRWILGAGWGALLLTIVFGQSVFLIRLLTWWTATANLLPASVGMLVCLAAYLRWTDRRSPGLAALACCGLFLALIDYETAMLLPAYVLLIRIVVMQDSFDPRAWARILWNERLIWIGVLGLDLLAFLNYEIVYYVPAKSPTVGQDLHFLFASAFQSFMPALFGYKRYPQLPSTLVVVLAALLLCVCLGVVLWRRPRAWRCLLVAVLAFPLGMLPLGLNEITTFGVDVGTELYYQQSVQFVTLVLLAFAVSPRWGGTRDGIGASRATWQWPARVSGRVRQRPALVTATLVALGAYGAVYVTSARQIATAGATPEPHQSRPYIDRFRADAARYLARTGRQPNLLNLTVPFGIVSSAFVPYNQYDEIFQLVDRRVVYDRWRKPLFYVDFGGGLRRARITDLAPGRLAQATVATAENGGTVIGGGSGSTVCTHGGNATQWIRVPMAGHVRRPPAAGLLGEEVGVVYKASSTVKPVIAASQAAGQVPIDYDPQVWSAGQGAVLAALDPGIDPYQLEFALPGGVCLTRVAVLAVNSG